MINPFIIAASFLALSLVACSGTSTGTGTSAGTGAGTGALGGGGDGETAGGAAVGGGGAPGAGAAPECASTCTRYLACKGADASQQALCVDMCGAQSFTSEELQSYEGLECTSLVAAIENRPNPNPNNPSPAPSATPKPSKQSKECAYGECVHDGSSCIWLSPSTGLHDSCPAYCCQ